MRSRFAPLLVVLLVVLAGCTGTIEVDSASPATLPQTAYESVGYVHGNTSAVPFTYPIAVGPIVRNVTATTYLSGYSKTTADGEVSAVALWSTPNAHVLGRTVNPLGSLTDRRLAETLLEQLRTLRDTGDVSDVNDVRLVGSENRTVLGETVAIDTYSATVDVDGEPTAVRFHLAVVEHGDDLVVALGVHPEAMTEDAAIAELFEHIEHESDESSPDESGPDESGPDE